MTFRYTGWATLAILGFVATPALHAQGVLITCSDQACEFKAIATLRINGKDSLRVLGTPNLASLTLAAIRAVHERKIDTMPGILRDPTANSFHTYSPSGTSTELVFPSGGLPKEATVAALWTTVSVTYRESTTAKKDSTIASSSLAGFLVGQDPGATTVAYARSLVAQPVSPRRNILLQAAVRFSATAPAYRAWRDQLATSLRDGLHQFQQHDGDPRHLKSALDHALADGDILVQIDSDSSNRTALAEARKEQVLLQRRLTIAAAFEAAEFWDEYLSKTQEIGLTKWSIADLPLKERKALVSSAQLHRAASEKLALTGLLDRAFDEAERAYRRDPCGIDVTVHFNNIRTLFVERNNNTSAQENSVPNRSSLQQLERQLRSLDASQLQQESYRRVGQDLIARGDAIDRTYPPFQLAKAQYLRNTGRLSEALDVAIEVQRHLALDAKQREDVLTLDANVSLGLSATRNRAQEEAKAHLDAGRFKEAFDATTPGLAADPNNPSLLLARATAAASLRQPDEALRAINALLRSNETACADPNLYERAFALRDAVALPAPTSAQSAVESGNGIPSWISGKKYPPGTYYDPISLAFLPRISMLNGSKVPQIGTVFTWDGLRLVSIETSLNLQNGKQGGGGTMFFVEPEYAPGTLRMTAIGPRAIQEGRRVSHPLTFWNDPRVNIALLQQSGRTAARGWAGNPVFDPLVWSGIFLFDFKYDNKGRVIEAVPVPDETRGRSFAETLTFTWDDANRLKTISSRSYRRVLEYDKSGRLVAEDTTLGKSRARMTYQYAGESMIPRHANSDTVFDKQQRSATFKQL